MTIEARVRAVQATLDAFIGKPFAWGREDCLRLAAHTLRGLGHKPRLHRGGAYSSEKGAARALVRAGFRDTSDWMDDFGFLRIPPAAALPGDILGFRHHTLGPWTCLAVAIGQGRMLAFVDSDDGAGPVCVATLPPFHVDGAEYVAWRCPPWVS